MKQKYFKKNDSVYWNWMGQKIFGKVIEIYLEPVIKDIKGKKIKRNGSSTNAAYYVQSEAGNFALKLQTELSLQDPSCRSLKTKYTPKIFS